MRSRLVLVLLPLSLIFTSAPALHAETVNKVIVLGDSIPISLLGSSLPSDTNSVGVIPPCPPGNDKIAATQSSLMCIKSFKYRSVGSKAWSDSALISGDISNYLDPSSNQPTNVKYGFSRIGSTDSWSAYGGSASIWQISNQVPKFLIEGAVSNQSKTKFSLSLVPVVTNSSANYSLNSQFKTTLSRTSFPKEIEYQIVLAMGFREQPLLWMTSRTNSGTVAKTFGPAQYTFEGEPQLHGVLTKSVTSCNKDFIQADLEAICERGLDQRISIQPSDEEILRYLNDAQLAGFVESSRVEEWGFQNGDTSNHANRYSMYIGDTEWACQMPLAVMSTNASVFSFIAPEWDKKTSQLNFKIANAHFDMDGKVSRGEFSITLDYWTASCMWNLNGNTSVAQVQILSDDGTAQKIFTSVVNMDSVANKAQVHIAGFEFSSPKIAIKLVDQAPSKVLPATKTRTTITCVKGKLSKKVTGAPPLCPSGYKKK